MAKVPVSLAARTSVELASLLAYCCATIVPLPLTSVRATWTPSRLTVPVLVTVPQMLDAGIGEGHATMWTGSLAWFGVAVERAYVTPAIANLAYPAGAGNRMTSNGETSPGTRASRVG